LVATKSIFFSYFIGGATNGHLVIFVWIAKLDLVATKSLLNNFFTINIQLSYVRLHHVSAIPPSMRYKLCNWFWIMQFVRVASWPLCCH
jgi:hypothetical protein